MTKQRVTMRDVAERTKVSINTVSLTLKGSALVHPETKATILAAVEELGYVPNLTAQNLRQGIVRTLGLMIPDMHNPHYWDIADGVEQAARQRGYGVVLSNTNLNPDLEMDSLRGLLERRYDGLILATHFLEDGQLSQLKDILQYRRPIVSFANSWDGVDRVRYYHEAAGSIMLEHLYALGHRRIGFVVGVAREGLADERIQAYREFVQQHGMPDLLQRCGPTIPDSVVATNWLLDLENPPTAIMAVNDYLALGVIRAVNQRKLRIPEDISVAGFDNTSLADTYFPALTTVDVGGNAIGKEAVQLLFDRLDHPERPDKIVEIPAKLIVRDSTGPVRG